MEEGTRPPGEALRVRLLGRAEVVRDTAVTPVTAPKERTVITALAMAAGASVSADALVDALWEDDPPPSCQKTLQNYVARLRRIVGADRLRYDGVGYCLAVDPSGVDVLELEGVVREARSHLEAERIRRADAAVRRARELCVGPVDVGSTTAFASSVHARVAQLRDAVVEVGAAVDLAAGRDPTAELDAALVLDPCRERLWELLVTALHANGRTADALRAFQRARDALADIGLEPGAGLRAAEQAVLAAAPAPAHVSPPPSWLLGSSRYPLVGRVDDIAAVEAAWSDACAGTPAVVVLTAEPGAGKTRLLSHLAAVALADGGTVIGGTADPDVSYPLGLLSEPFATLTERRPDPTLDELLEVGARSTPDAWLAEVGRACAASLERASAEAPALLVLDDVQWADSASARAIPLLIRQLRGRVLIAIAARLDVDDALLAAILRGRAVRHRSLQPLDTLDIAALAAAARTEVDADALAARTGGNALLVAELLASGDTTSTPMTITTLVAERVGRLAPDDRTALTTAAIGGVGVDASVVAHVLGRPVEDVTAALDRAERASLVVANGSTLAYRFAHHLTWSCILDVVPRNERAQRHARFADVLAERCASIDRIAHHLVSAGEAGDPAAALDTASRAADAAAARAGFEEASAWIRRAREVAELLPSDPVRDTELRVQEARFLDLAGHVVDARRHLVQTARDMPAQLPAELLVRMATLYAGAPGALLDPHDVDGRALAERAAAAVPADDRALRCAVRCVESAWRLFDSRADDRVAPSEEAVSLARDLGDRSLLGRALGARWAAGDGFCEPDDQLAISEEWVALLDGADALIPLVRGWGDLVSVGLIGDARRRVDRIDAIALATSWSTARFYGAVLRGFHACMNGDRQEACRALAAAEDEPIATWLGTSIGVAWLRVGIARMEAGDEVAPLEALALPMVGRSVAVAARRALADGQVDEARSRFSDYLGAIDRLPPSIVAHAVAAVAPDAARAADAGVIRGLIAALDRQPRRWAVASLSLPLGRLELASGILRLAVGDIEDAVDDLATAHAAHVAANADGLAERSGSALHAALAAAGRPADILR